MNYLLPVWVCLGLVLALPVWGQSIETEFRVEAPTQWLELRKNAFDSIAIAVEKTVESIRPGKEGGKSETRIIKTKYTQFTQGEFKSYESSPLSDTDPGVDVPFNRRFLRIHNPHQTFMMYKDPEASWVLLNCEDSPSTYPFVDESIQRSWIQRQDSGPLNGLTALLGKDPRLTIARETPVESWVTRFRDLDDGCFCGFRVIDDPDLGRVVLVRLVFDSGEMEIPSKRMPRNTKRVTMNGEMRFLADWKWVPVEMTQTTTQYDATGKVLRDSKRSFSALYDSKQVEDARKTGSNLLPRRVTIASGDQADAVSDQVTYRIRKLSPTEIKAIESQKTLSDFGLEK